MPSSVRFAKVAAEELGQLFIFRSAQNQDAGDRARKFFQGAFRKLWEIPHLGVVMGDGSGRREWPVLYAGEAIVLRYILDAETDSILILRIYQQSRLTERPW